MKLLIGQIAKIKKGYDHANAIVKVANVNGKMATVFFSRYIQGQSFDFKFEVPCKALEV